MAKFALWILSYVMKKDPDYAWTWHCNLAMMALTLVLRIKKPIKEHRILCDEHSE